MQHSVGNNKEDPLDVIWNGTNMKEIRRDMLEEIPNRACTGCYEQEKHGFFSGRKSANKHHGHHIGKALKTTDAGTIQDFNMSYWDIRFSNLCNLSCRSCGHIFSSSWYNDQAELAGPEWKENNKALLVGGNSKTDIIDQVMEHIDYVEQIYFAGGEPLMMSSHYQILDELIRLGKTDIKISYNTNFTILKYKNTSITNYWRKFTNIHVGASLDAMNKHIEYIRHGTVWDDVVHNYDNICDDESINIDFSITANINIFNAFNLIHAQRFWIEDKNLLPPKHSISILTDPPELCIQTLPLEFKHKLDTMIETHIVFLGNYDSIQLVKTWTEIRKFLWKRDNSAMISSFFNTVDRLDSIRDENFDEVFTEYSDLRTK
jgi:organic radical activating enzyme